MVPHHIAAQRPVARACPAPGDRGAVDVFWGLTSPGGSFWNEDRYGETVPCDGDRHRVDMVVVRHSDSPCQPTDRRATGRLGLTLTSCVVACTQPFEVTPTTPIRLSFHGFDQLPF